MPGPPPKHPSERRRRNATPPLRQLPAEGRKGRVPKWPLPPALLDSTIYGLVPNIEEGELELWGVVWHTPQAVAWEQLGYIREVAQYVRWKVRAELGDMDAAKEARMLADRLGLTPMSMLRLRWEIVGDGAAEDAAGPELEPVADIRSRMRAKKRGRAS